MKKAILVIFVLFCIGSCLPSNDNNQTTQTPQNNTSSQNYALDMTDVHWVKDNQNGAYIWNPEPGENESITWNGDYIQDGDYRFAEGSGTLTWYKDGEVIQVDEGTFKHGRHHGQFKHTFPSGRVDYSNWNNGTEINLDESTPTTSVASSEPQSEKERPSSNKEEIKREIQAIKTKANNGITVGLADSIIQKIDGQIRSKSALLGSAKEDFEEHKHDTDFFKISKVVSGLYDTDERQFNRKLTVLYLINKDTIERNVPAITVEDFSFANSDINKYARKRVVIHNLLMEYTSDNSFVEKATDSYGAILQGKNCHIIAALDKPIPSENEIYSIEGYIAGVYASGYGFEKTLAELHGKSTDIPPDEDPPILIFVGKIVN